MSPAISIIMGVYNDENFLEEAILSVLNQTYCDFEFLICDDGSTDGSREIIKKFAKKDSRIVYIENEKNMGLANVLNKLLDIARGVYIARMDSDDIMVSHRLETQLKFLEKNADFSIVGSNIKYIDNNGMVYKSLSLPENINLDIAVKKFCIVHPSVLMKKTVLDEVDGYTVNKNTQRAEDYDLWCKLLYKGFKITNIQDDLMLYREDLSGLKKRKYRYRIQEYKLKMFWMKKTGQPLRVKIYAFRPLIVGLIPIKIMSRLRKR